jgi:cellulose synthase/poly-beta-1,6-N-acetylglucosamine synthase-like glycosyltransferase
MTGIAAVQTVATIVAMLVVATGVLQNLVYIAQIGLAYAAMLSRPPIERFAVVWQRYADETLPVSIIVPAFNEEKTIMHNVRSLLALNYPAVEMIVVNDGSTDRTLEVLRTTFGVVATTRDVEPILPHRPVRAVYTAPHDPRLVVIDKDNGGKADAANCAINYARSPLICAIDADSILEPDAILRAVQPFIEDPERTVAVGATVRIANGCRIERGHVAEIGLPRNPLALVQTVEYLRSFLMGRLGWSMADLTLIVAGAFGLFRRQAVLDVGGYSHNTVGEDLELVVKLHRHMRDGGADYRITFIPEPVCWTEAPETLRALPRQRARWARGALETFFKHCDMLVKPRYGRIGSVGFLNVLLVDVLGPPVEVLGYLLVPLLWGLDLLATDYFLAFLAVTFSFGVAVSTSALALEEIELRRFARARDLFVLFLVAVAENFGYRQLNNVWRVHGLWQYLRGGREWGMMTRRGFSGG